MPQPVGILVNEILIGVAPCWGRMVGAYGLPKGIMRPSLHIEFRSLLETNSKLRVSPRTACSSLRSRDEELGFFELCGPGN